MTDREHLQWVITGPSQGFGRSLTAEVLRRGDDVLAVVHDEASVADLVVGHPDLLTVTVADLR